MIDESGLKPWESCALCHSLNGISRMAKFPKLAGQVPAYIEKQIWDFREGHRTNDGAQMKAMAEIIKAEDIRIVARYFAELDPPPPAEPVSPAMSRIAKKLVSTGDDARGITACQSCHGAAQVSSSGAPRIEAQHADYIAKQLSDFRSGERGNDPGEVMRQLAKRLTDEEIRALGGFIAAQNRE